MDTDVLIIGQGICGTMLSWYLQKEGVPFVVMDDGNQFNASKIAAGIINPVTGRRYVTTWMIDELMSFAKTSYEEMGMALETEFIFSRSLIDFFPSPQMRNAFINRLTEDDRFLHSFPDQNHFNQYFNYDFGCGEIRPSYMVNMGLVLAAMRKSLSDQNAFLEEEFEVEELHLTKDGISYKQITADKIIFCDGIRSMQHPWFNLLPFAPNKGEALVIESEELSSEHIFKKGMVLAPLPVKNTFWVGSNYEWEFEDDQPSEKFYKQATGLLDGWLKKPYKVLFHKASIRPATLERRPFVGFHPHLPQIGMLNGMGTKGASLAPYFANQLCQHMVHGLPIQDDASIHRFSRILGK
jgi:glycine/D-amino acid oxidase-like deaminating enzyme